MKGCGMKMKSLLKDEKKEHAKPAKSMLGGLKLGKKGTPKKGR